MPETTQTALRIAVAQSTVREDPTDADGLRASAAEIRRLMKDAADAGARLVHFTEGAICFPSKFVMSELGPDQVGRALGQCRTSSGALHLGLSGVSWSRYTWAERQTGRQKGQAMCRWV
jgi:hypothetical protein